MHIQLLTKKNPDKYDFIEIYWNVNEKEKFTMGWHSNDRPLFKSRCFKVP